MNNSQSTIVNLVLPLWWVICKPSFYNAWHWASSRLALVICLVIELLAAQVELPKYMVALVGIVRVLIEAIM